MLNCGRDYAKHNVAFSLKFTIGLHNKLLILSVQQDRAVKWSQQHTNLASNKKYKQKLQLFYDFSKEIFCLTGFDCHDEHKLTVNLFTITIDCIWNVYFKTQIISIESELNATQNPLEVKN